MTIDQAYTLMYSITLIALAVLIGVMLICSIRGPQLTDRLLAVNMICTMVIAAILILCALLKEQYLADVALIYALISFVSLILFASVYIRRRDHTAQEENTPSVSGGNMKKSAEPTALFSEGGKEDR